MAIEILPSDVVNQIAAGEVVERPAHLVKELIENSLDAGASEISVDVLSGGRSVAVQDNGSGMKPSDLPLAVARHATSKIGQAEDLWSLRSYGFRGEALAAIAAVSRLKITSREGAAPCASLLSVEFGAPTAVVDSSGETGTRVEISDLFANLPARLSFLRSETAEVAQIKNVLRALALANPGVAFRVRVEGKLFAYWPQADLRERATQVLDAGELFLGEVREGGWHVQVLAAPPSVVERTSRQIWLLVQGRWVQDRALQAAVIDGFRSTLMHGEFPVAVVHIHLDPTEVDVNVHPAKSQVKFRDPQLAFRLVQRATRQIVESAPWRVGEQSFEPADAGNRERLSDEAQTLWVETASPRDQAVPAPLPAESAAAMAAPRAAVLPAGGWSQLKVLGQLRQTYLVVESPEGLTLIDQHAAHERINFERLSRQRLAGGLEIQNFLLPLSVSLAVDAAEALLAQAPRLSQLGIQLEAGGPEVVLVTAAPVLVREAALVKALELAAEEFLLMGGSGAPEAALDHVIATLACHSSIRAGQSQAPEEMRALLEQMDEFPMSDFCPHGRPVSVFWSWSELERKFGRLV